MCLLLLLLSCPEVGSNDKATTVEKCHKIVWTHEQHTQNGLITRNKDQKLTNTNI